MIDLLLRYGGTNYTPPGCCWQREYSQAVWQSAKWRGGVDRSLHDSLRRLEADFNGV